jgi:hypothetical protein
VNRPVSGDTALCLPGQNASTAEIWFSTGGCGLPSSPAGSLTPQKRRTIAQYEHAMKCRQNRKEEMIFPRRTETGWCASSVLSAGRFSSLSMRKSLRPRRTLRNARSENDGDASEISSTGTPDAASMRNQPRR